jgi:mediator of RNA polymerase II transcription subunit 14
LLTALSLRAAGTYTRFPTSFTDFFTPKQPLTQSVMIDTIQRLNDHIRYRLKCVDYVPPELVIEKVTDGRVHVRGGGPNGWIAQLTVVAFGDDSRWCLTGVEWAWQADGSRQAIEFTTGERQGILQIANTDVLNPREIPEAVKETAGIVDSPLVRICNFLQHLSLTYQLEVLFTQAVALSQSRWRGNLMADVDRMKKELRLRYWM